MTHKVTRWHPNQKIANNLILITFALWLTYDISYNFPWIIFTKREKQENKKNRLLSIQIRRVERCRSLGQSNFLLKYKTLLSVELGAIRKVNKKSWAKKWNFFEEF